MRLVLNNRRGFLHQCGSAAAAFLFDQRAQAHSADVDFHLHPNYREQTPLDAALSKLDGEPEHDRFASVLQLWSAGLLKSARLEPALSSSFEGVSFRPLQTWALRPSAAGLTVERLRFETQAALSSEAFLGELKSSFAVFSKVLTADFQITRMQSARMTRVRYEIVGTGTGFFREQRTGYWLIDWNESGVIRWRMEDETRSRATERFYSDVTRSAFHRNPSYELQLSHGADYWRTNLDGASGIDIYGHNGISVGDINGRGLDDLYVCQAAGLPNRLYRNQGDGTFEDITEIAGVGVLDNTACALFADFSNRGRQDLLVVRANGPLLFQNQGNSRFTLKPDAFLFAHPPQGTFTGASAADYNRDGFLDIYFCLYAYYQGTGQYKYPAPYFAAENGPPNFLMQNNGDGTFQDVTAKCGLDKNNTRYSFCCAWNDYNQDAWPDLYVANDFGRKNLYRNNGDGTFTDVAAEAGVEDVGAGMSACWPDYNNDGKPDLYVGNMWTAAGERISHGPRFQEAAPESVRDLYRKHAMGDSLFKNLGSAFVDTTDISQSAVGRWAWSSDSWDFDHDGFADLYVANGMISGPIKKDLNSFFWREVVGKSPNSFQPNADYEQGWNAVNEWIRSDYSWSGPERNVLFANNQDGTFADIAGIVGLDFIEDGRAFALADMDGDGRQEVFVKNRNAPQLRLLKNTVSQLPPAIAFRLQGIKSNRDAIGATIMVQTTSGRQTKSLQAGSGFLSQHSKEVFFGLGNASGDISATIRWPSGLVQQYKDLPADHRISITEGADGFRLEAFKTATALNSFLQGRETLPDIIETWLLTPVLAPTIPAGIPTLLCFRNASATASEGRNVIVEDPKNQDLCAIYNLLFRSLFDRHRDMPLPTSFLINEHREIVKVYQGPVDYKTIQRDRNNSADLLSKALPFPGHSSSYEYGRNYLSLGSLFFQRGYPEYAEDFFQSALKQDPSSAEAFYGIGSVSLKQGKNSIAQENFESVLKLTASYPETTPNAWNNLGILATREGNTEKAISCFQQALHLNPDHFIALENLGNAYRQQKQWPEARAALERALSLKPTDAEANYSLGMVFAQSNDTDKAEQYLGKAIQARTPYPEALNNLGILYLRTHRRKEAVALFRQCIELVPAFDQSYLNLARVYAIEGNSNEARAVLNALLLQHPASAPAKQALAQLP